jgi:hypothetical protein
MRRDATGQPVATKRQKGTVWGLRFRTASGERVYETLGRSSDGMSRREAERAADEPLARVRLGIYRTRAERERERAEREARRDEAPLFARFADEWFERRCDLGGRAGNGRPLGAPIFAISWISTYCRGSQGCGWTRSTSRRSSATRRRSGARLASARRT